MIIKITMITIIMSMATNHTAAIAAEIGDDNEYDDIADYDDYGNYVFNVDDCYH